MVAMQGAALAQKNEAPIEKPAKDIEKQEQSLTTAAAVDKMKELQTQVEALRMKAQNLSESLAQANTEAAQQKDDYSRMRLQMEALGVAALKGDERSLQTRLLDAVNDFRLAEEAKQQLTEHLVQLHYLYEIQRCREPRALGNRPGCWPSGLEEITGCHTARPGGVRRG
jgi:septal ring factor EnvC (AmiA/AmiB activator)